jgi:hypothetical protein
MLLSLLLCRRTRCACGVQGAVNDTLRDPQGGVRWQACQSGCAHGRTPLVMVAVEKRVNFTIEEQAVCAPGFEHFLNCLHAATFEGMRLAAQQEDIEGVPQVFDYERGEHLVLMRISLQQFPWDALLHECLFCRLTPPAGLSEHSESVAAR